MNTKMSPNPKAHKTQGLSNLIGDRGESIFQLVITDYQQFNRPLFKPGFLGEKWPTIDFYVELLDVKDSKPFFFVQVKSTATNLLPNATALEISTEKKKCVSLFKIPGPTYIVGIHEPTKKAYILSVHEKPTNGIYRIPLKNELTPANLKILHEEVQQYWLKNNSPKPLSSNFS